MSKGRIEALLENYLGGENELEEPQSRTERLLMALLEQKYTRKVMSAVVDKKKVPAHSRVLIEFTFDLPEGYEIFAYRNFSMQKGTGGGDEWKNVALQFFSTAGGGKKAQIAVINTGDTDAIIKAQVNVLVDVAISAAE